MAELLCGRIYITYSIRTLSLAGSDHFLHFNDACGWVGGETLDETRFEIEMEVGIDIKGNFPGKGPTRLPSE